MGAVTFDQFKAFVLLRLGNRTELQSVSSVDYYGIVVNQAYRQICTSRRLPETDKRVWFPQLESVTSTDITATAGTAYISVPTNSLLIHDVICTYSGKERDLDWCPPERYKSYTNRRLTASRGTPREWTHIGNFIYLYPTPDAAYTYEVWFRLNPPDMVSGASTLIGSEWDQAIMLLASYKLANWVGDKDKSSMARAEYIEYISGIAGIYGEEERDRNENIRPDYAYLRANRGR